jgi:hypothetical protein
MNLKTFLRHNVLNNSILLFILLFSIIHFTKPSLIYNKDGSFRIFGVGFRDKTIISIWVVSIILAILCYIFVSYFTYSI